MTTLRSLEPGGRLLLLAEFKDNGANIDQRLMEWMRAREMRWQGPGSIQWAGDASEDMGIRLMRWSGFHIRMSKRGGRTPMRERRVSMVSARLAKDGAGIPALRYLRQLRRWEAEMLRYRRAKPAFEGDPRRREIIAVDDHLMTSTQYMIELVDGPPAPAGDSREPKYAEILH